MKKVLLADDKASSRELIRTVLESLAFEVSEAIDGLEALDRAREVRPDLIILDLQMPKLDGFGVVSQLRREPQFAHTPVMALTASAMYGDRQRAIEAGFDSYVSKPVPLFQLRDEVGRLLQNGRVAEHSASE